MKNFLLCKNIFLEKICILMEILIVLFSFPNNKPRPNILYICKRIL